VKVQVCVASVQLYFKVRRKKKSASKPKFREHKYLRVNKKTVVSHSVALFLEGACVCVSLASVQVLFENV
jgi:hypothetical protein